MSIENISIKPSFILNLTRLSLCNRIYNQCNTSINFKCFKTNNCLEIFTKLKNYNKFVTILNEFIKKRQDQYHEPHDCIYNALIPSGLFKYSCAGFIHRIHLIYHKFSCVSVKVERMSVNSSFMSANPRINLPNRKYCLLSCRQGADLWTDVVCELVPFFMS